jgi:hypothetical protein
VAFLFYQSITDLFFSPQKNALWKEVGVQKIRELQKLPEAAVVKHPHRWEKKSATHY